MKRKTSRQAPSIVRSSEELSAGSVIKDYLIAASDGKAYSTKHHNLQAIIAVGFKVNNPRGV